LIDTDQQFFDYHDAYKTGMMDPEKWVAIAVGIGNTLAV
jgi:hypothetical protein